VLFPGEKVKKKTEKDREKAGGKKAGI